MKKKLIGRGLLGFPVGIAIGYVITAVSYTHLDVYKRQVQSTLYGGGTHGQSSFGCLE